MTKSKINQETIDRLMVEMEGILEREKSMIRHTERGFHVQTGARLAIDAVRRAGMLNEGAGEIVGRWALESGVAHLDYDGVSIWPVKL